MFINTFYMNVIDVIQAQMSPQMISQLTQSIGAQSDDQTEAAISGVINTLVAGLSKNVEQPGGAAALVSAIDRDHDGGILENLANIFLGGGQPASGRTTDGVGILRHILGNNQAPTTDMLSKVTGLNNSQIMKLMITLAPIVLGALGKFRNQQNLNTGGMADLLKQTVNTQANQGQGMGMLQRFLDSNGDGSVIDDIANIGMGIFMNRR